MKKKLKRVLDSCTTVVCSKTSLVEKSVFVFLDKPEKVTLLVPSDFLGLT